MSKPLRTFLAVELPQTVTGRLRTLTQLFEEIPAEVRWVRPETFHITMKFLGSIRWEEIHEVCLATEKACQRLACFDVTLGTLGAFPNLDAPHTIWVGASEGMHELRELAERIDVEMEQLGFRREARLFQPHITLGKVRAEAECSPDLLAALKAHQDFEAGQFTVEGVTVFTSTLGKHGPKYENIGYAPLA